MTKELIGKLRELSDRVFHGDTKPGDFRIIDRAADALEAATRERAAVPDAATELSEMRKMVEEAKQNPDGVEWQTFWDRMTEDQIIELMDAASIARAERDAALAAVERVAALASRAQTFGADEFGAFKRELLAALDGAPEPGSRNKVAADALRTAAQGYPFTLIGVGATCHEVQKELTRLADEMELPIEGGESGE